MKVLIIEDEKPAADKLKQLLLKIDNSFTIMDTIGTVEGSINWLQSNPDPDLILMDIHLSDGISFEIFCILKITTPIIFVTAYDEYAIKAFKVNSIDYLLKPIDLESLAGAVAKFKSLIPAKTFDSNRITNIFDELPKSHRTRFLVKVGLYYHSVLTNDIECFFIKEHGTFLRTLAGKIYDLDYSLEQLQGMIEPASFFRINRNYVVNINSIVKILTYSTNRLKLELKNTTDDDLIVSREKVSEFKEWLNR